MSARELTIMDEDDIIEQQAEVIKRMTEALVEIRAALILYTQTGCDFPPLEHVCDADGVMDIRMRIEYALTGEHPSFPSKTDSQ